MKIRTGFVSNSSSTSFTLYGTSIDIDEMVKKIKLVSNNILEDEEIEENFDELFEETFNKILASDNLTYVSDRDGGVVYIGRAPEEFEDLKLVVDNKNEVVSALKKNFGVTSAHWISEEIYG